MEARATQVPALTPAPPAQKRGDSLRMSYEEFLDWAGEDNVRAEWVPIQGSEKGKVIVQMPPTDIHQAILGFLSNLLNLFVRFLDLGQVRIAPFEVRLNPDGSSRKPDILFVATEHLGRLTPNRLEAAPDLIIEIISPDSVKRDRSDKYHEYRNAGVREYWIIDPREGHERADFFYMDEHGDYHLFATEEDARVDSHVLSGFWLRPEWLWQANDLNPLMLFLEIRGASPEQVEQVMQILGGQEI